MSRVETGRSEQVEVINSLAHMYRANGYAGRALVLLLVAQELDPEDSGVQLNLAHVLFLNGKLHEALTVLERFLAVNREILAADDPVHLLHARILWALDRKERSRTIFHAFAQARRGAVQPVALAS
ncbi:MAG: hypothetical protein R3C97_08470 [Geminicoccaceae bacterium]